MKILQALCWGFMKFTNIVFELFTLFGRRTLFQQRAGEFCQRSTLHGVADWYRADTSHMRIFWTIFFLGAFGAAVYGCYAILEQYLVAPVVVSYFVQQPDDSLRIPDVVICPFNRFDKYFFNKHNISEDLIQYVEFAFGKLAKHPVQSAANEKISRKLRENLKDYAVKLNYTLSQLNMTFNEFLDEASIQCRDIIVSCGSATNEGCCNGTSVMTGSGKCYRIAGKEQGGSGYPFAMTIVVNLPKERYTFSPNNFMADGIAVKLADKGMGVDFDLTFIPVGTHAVMPLRATKYAFINHPPAYHCSDDMPDTYSHMACLDSCPWITAQNKCGCSLPGASFQTSLPSCTVYDLQNCFYKLENFVDEKINKCMKNCLPRCNYVQYATALSYANFPSDEAEHLAPNASVWQSMKNSIVLDVYYERFEYTVIKHYPAMTVNTFIANIGGQYSLWLGGSVLTLIQVVVFLMQYLYNKCCEYLVPDKKTKQDKRRNHASNSDSAVVVRLARECSNSIGWDTDERQRKKMPQLLRNNSAVVLNNVNKETNSNNSVQNSSTPNRLGKSTSSRGTYCREFLF